MFRVQHILSDSTFEMNILHKKAIMFRIKNRTYIVYNKACANDNNAIMTYPTHSLRKYIPNYMRIAARI